MSKNKEKANTPNESVPQQLRGQLTERIKLKSKELLGYEISLHELRLMPYLQYEMVNFQKINPLKVNEADRKVLAKWRKAGHIDGGASGLCITEEFWNIMHQIIFLGYVDLTD